MVVVSGVVKYKALILECLKNSSFFYNKNLYSFLLMA